MLYTITIYLASNSRWQHDYDMPYYMSGAKKDHVVFGVNTISISAERKKRFSENDIFLNVQNSLYNQMYKCLLFHYAMNEVNSKITKIGIRVCSKTNCLDNFERNFDNDNQPFPISSFPIPFNPNIMDYLLEETDDAYQFRLIMAHWMSAMQENDALRKLECIWRTFERLCAYHRHRPIGERPVIADGLRKMIEELTSNSHYYTESASYVHDFDDNYLRVFLWHDMIANNYPKGSSINRYQDYVNYLVLSFQDSRVIRLMYDVRHYREADLKRYNLYSSMKHDCTTKLRSPMQKDIDVVAILCCHYAYYLRNRLFHGQSLVRYSIFDPHMDMMRLDVISHLLELLSIELINNISNL